MRDFAILQVDIDGGRSVIVLAKNGKNGKAIVLTGWQAWLAGAALFVCVALLVAFFVFVFLGVAITLGAVLLIILPVIVGITIIAAAFRSPKQ